MAKLTPMKAIRKNVLNVLAEVSTKLNYVLLKNPYRFGHRPVQGRENQLATSCIDGIVRRAQTCTG